MQEQTTQVALAALDQVKPWRRGMAWWAVMLQGIIALAIGIYILTQPQAGANVLLLMALFLLAINVERALMGFRELIPLPIMAERMLRAGIGLTVGLIVVLNAWQPFMTSPAPAVILSLGWLLIGAVGLWEWFVARGELRLGLGALISPLISAVFGLLMLVSRLSLTGAILQMVGYLGIIGGLALLGYAFFLYRRSNAPTLEAAQSY